jgi:hypothetical protein
MLKSLQQTRVVPVTAQGKPSQCDASGQLLRLLECVKLGIEVRVVDRGRQTRSDSFHPLDLKTRQDESREEITIDRHSSLAAFTKYIQTELKELVHLK